MTTRAASLMVFGAVLAATIALQAADAPPSSGTPAPLSNPAPRAAATPAAAGIPSAAAPARDPFRPIFLTRKAKVEKPKTPLEQYDVGALKLVAVIYDTQNPKAMVEDDAGLGYTVGIGTAIGNAGGVVKGIEPDRVIVEEEFIDFYGEKKKTQVVLRLKPEGEKRP